MIVGDKLPRRAFDVDRDGGVHCCAGGDIAGFLAPHQLGREGEAMGAAFFQRRIRGSQGEGAFLVDREIVERGNAIDGGDGEGAA